MALSDSATALRQIPVNSQESNWCTPEAEAFYRPFASGSSHSLQLLNAKGAVSKEPGGNLENVFLIDQRVFNSFLSV